jgi:hypothetical protein
MSLTYQVPFLQTVKVTPQSWTNADSANTKKTVVTAGTNGTKVVGMTATSTDTSTRVAQVWLTRSATSYLLASVSIPAASGSDGTTVGINLMGTTLWPGLPVDNDGQVYLWLQSGDTLKVSFTAQVTSAKEIDVMALSADF